MKLASMKCPTPPQVEDRERPKEEAGKSRLVGGSFHKQRELTYYTDLLVIIQTYYTDLAARCLDPYTHFLTH